LVPAMNSSGPSLQSSMRILLEVCRDRRVQPTAALKKLLHERLWQMR
jgi:hypothetical protein